MVSAGLLLPTISSSKVIEIALKRKEFSFAQLSFDFSSNCSVDLGLDDARMLEGNASEVLQKFQSDSRQLVDLVQARDTIIPYYTLQGILYHPRDTIKGIPYHTRETLPYNTILGIPYHTRETTSKRHYIT